uniref:Uncharacterized protein n=1 Tax=Aegilops tauschii TaxID=37682 RepID=M8CMT4_AEGTA
MGQQAAEAAKKKFDMEIKLPLSGIEILQTLLDAMQGHLRLVPSAGPTEQVVLTPNGTSSNGNRNKGRRRSRRKRKETAKEEKECVPSAEEVSIRIAEAYESGDPLGRKELGRCVMQWLKLGMCSMASTFASTEVQNDGAAFSLDGGSSEGNLEFMILAQPYLAAIPMPQGHEALCLKASTHYPTLFDHFQRELREVLLKHQNQGLISDWRSTESWILLKKLAKSTQHRQGARKPKAPAMHSLLGISLDKTRLMQTKIEDFVKKMSDLLDIERDAELEFTQEELNATPTTDSAAKQPLKPVAYLVSHGQAEQEQCDTVCNLNVVSTSTGLGGLRLVLFRLEGTHKLPPSTLSPGDMVCVRTCNNQGEVGTYCVQGFIHNLGEDGCSITVSLKSRPGDPTFSKFSGKSVRIDRIQALADGLTYERNCEALILLQRKGLQKTNASIGVVATLFGDKEDMTMLEQNNLTDWGESAIQDNGLLGKNKYDFDASQSQAITLGLNKKRPVLVIQGPPGTGKTGLLSYLIKCAVRQGERVLVTAPSNAAVDNMVEKLSGTGLNIVRVGNPARISPSVSSRSLGELVKRRLEKFTQEFQRKKSNLRKDLKHCIQDDSLAAGIRQLLKKLGKNFRKKENEIIKEVLSNADVVLSTNIGAADPLIKEIGFFDLVIIDEAGQAIEPSCWIPILRGKRCILAGDQHQLAPVILSREAMQGGLGMSLLERASSLHDELLTTKLTMQYRMHESIANWASNEMYFGLLKSSPSVASCLLVDYPSIQIRPTYQRKISEIQIVYWWSIPDPCRRIANDYRWSLADLSEDSQVKMLASSLLFLWCHKEVLSLLFLQLKDEMLVREECNAVLLFRGTVETWITRCALLLLDTRMPYGSLNIDCEEHLDLAGTGSFYNSGEADIVAQHVVNLVLCGLAKPATRERRGWSICGLFNFVHQFRLLVLLVGA